MLSAFAITLVYKSTECLIEPVAHYQRKVGDFSFLLHLESKPEDKQLLMNAKTVLPIEKHEQ